MVEFQHRLLLDTNIYGELSKEREITILIEKIMSQQQFIFYGIKEIIRKEIRSIPPNIKLSGKNLRILILWLYDSIIKEHELSLTPEMNFIAQRYYDAYREFGGSKSKESIIHDLLIVACATCKRMDILVSNDNYTMLTENAIRAYNLINKTKNLKMPQFINYAEFKRRLFSV